MSVIESAMVGAGVAVAGTLLFATMFRPRADARADCEAGRIRCGRTLGVVSLVMGAVATGGVLYGGAWLNGNAVALIFGAALVYAMLVQVTFLLPGTDVEWGGGRVTGPAGYRPWPLRPRRPTIRFADIARTGTDLGGSWYIADAEGSRILWSFLYPGNARLWAALRRARPDLFA